MLGNEGTKSNMVDVIASSHVMFGVEAETKEDSLALFSSEACRLGIAEDRDSVLAAYRLREREGATGLIEGFSIPHAKSDSIKRPAVLVQAFSRPVEDWETLDGSRVSCAISLLVPGGEAGDAHIKLLSQVAVMIMDKEFRSAVGRAEDAEGIYGLILSRLAAD